MNFMIKNYFLLTLFVIYIVTSDESQILKTVNETQKDTYNVENEDYRYYINESLHLINKQMELNEISEIQSRKIGFLKRLTDYRTQILKSRKNTLKQFSKMMYDTENLIYLMKKSLRKMNSPETLEDLIRYAGNMKLWNELVRSMNLLEDLNEELSQWENEIKSSIHVNYAHVWKAVKNIIKEDSIIEDEGVLKVSWNYPNNEGLKFDIDLECDELERLQRFSLMVLDELNEMPKLRHEIPEDHKKSQSGTQETLPEVPLWLFHERDIEKIQEEYIKWMLAFTYSKTERIKQLEENIMKSGLSKKYFIKTLAEIYHLFSKSLECKAKEDTECEEIINEITNRKHFKELMKVFFAGTKTEELTLRDDYRI